MPGRTIDERRLKDFLKARLSAYKVPKRFFTVDDFPRSPAGKLLKRKLRESYLKGRAPGRAALDARFS